MPPRPRSSSIDTGRTCEAESGTCRLPSVEDQGVVEGDAQPIDVDPCEAAVPRRGAGGGEHATPVRVVSEGCSLHEGRRRDTPGDRDGFLL